MKYQYHGAGLFPEEEDYMDANMRVIDSDLRKAVTEEDYNEIKTQRRGWYSVSIDIEYQEWTGHTNETTFTGEVVADSMLDAYNKAKNHETGIRAVLPEGTEFTRIARIDKTDIDFLGMKNDEGYSIEDWEEWMAEQEDAQPTNPRQIRQQAIADSEHWWYCDNIVNHKGQLGLLRMAFPRVFILVRNEDELFCSFEEFRDCIAEVNFLDPKDREGTDIEEILIEAWNFLSLQEQEEERLYEENNGYEDDDDIF